MLTNHSFFPQIALPTWLSLLNNETHNDNILVNYMNTFWELFLIFSDHQQIPNQSL